MEIQVTLYAPLTQGRFKKGSVSLESGGTVDTLLQFLAIEQHEVGSVFVDGQNSTFTHVLQRGDKVTLLPLIGGG